LRSVNISIRAARPADAGSIAELTGQLGYALTAEDAAARLSKILSKRDQQFLIAEAGGRVLGWMHAALSEHIDSATCVVIEGLVVDRNHRGQGIGKLLLARAEHWAKASGYSLVRLRSTSTRTGAHRFYEHLGYTNVKTQYSFAKGLDAAGRDAVKRLAPRVEN
jgi:GNAT superfamily N-acetyltransferase